MEASDEEAERFFDPRTDLPARKEKLRKGQLELERLAHTGSAGAAERKIADMSVDMLRNIVLMATVHQRTAYGKGNELPAWSRDFDA